MDKVYILDTNVFIEAADRYYGFDFAPGLWISLINYADTGKLGSIDRVKHELQRGKDDLASWVNEHFKHAFLSTDEEFRSRMSARLLT
jgi:hypothetical protein